MCEFLGKLASDNLFLAAVIGQVWAVLVTLFPAFQNLSYAAKRWAVFALCMGLPILALVISVYQCTVPLTADAIVAAVSAGCAAFTGSQIIAHLLIRASKS